MSTVAHYYKVNPEKLRRSYKKRISDFEHWSQKQHAEKYLVYQDNISDNLAIDEVSLSKGELYTIVSSREKNRKRKGKLVAIIAGTKTENITEVLNKIDLEKRNKVVEVSMDMAASMSKASRISFRNATQVVDRFHVVRLVAEALQSVRIEQRWKEIDNENKLISKSKKAKTKYKPKLFRNGDTAKQLLARSRHLLYKLPHQWTESQIVRAGILFQAYPTINKAYRLSIDFRKIYEKKQKSEAIKLLDEWMMQVKEYGIEHFNSVVASIMNHYEGIMNFFSKRSTNASAESFNAQLKLFRANQRGVKDVSFFLFRLEKLFA